ncbi:MAG: xanthine phosphoribosyltransferase [Hyphomonadaceae bacterium]|nr:xanthine phosphoribosyltransferase [Clostridia bacterium]
MDLLKDRISKDGEVLSRDVLKVDSFLNHQMDVGLLDEMGKEFARLFCDVKVDKIVTVEASGIAVACFAARYFDVPVVFAKKHATSTLTGEAYESAVYSFTKQTTFHIRISKKYLKPCENILVIDDFLANGKAALGLIDLVHQAGANLMGVGVVIEKGFQNGGDILRKMGIRVESLAIIEAMNGHTITYRV